MSIAGYRTNQNLKGINEKTDYTQEQISEYVKCSSDPIYFILNYVWIINVDKGLILFDLFEYQKRMIKTIHDNRHVIMTSPRQSGKTAVVAAYMVWLTIFNDNYTIAVLANKEKMALEILDRYQKSYESLPKWLQHGIKSYNKLTLELENGSRIFASGTSSSAIRGFSINFLYLDEFAFLNNNIADQFYTSVYPVISSGTTTKMVISSTPNGMNLFYKLYNDAVKNKNDFKGLRIYWHEHPHRNEAWKLEQLRNMDQRKFSQEYDCDFLGSSNTLISGSALSEMVTIDPIRMLGEDTSIYEEPIKDIFDNSGNVITNEHVYFIICDTSEGLNLDYHCFSVFDCSQIPYRQVAVYRNNTLTPILLPNIIKAIGTYYNNAYVLIEIKSSGAHVADILKHDEDYDNILCVSTGNKQSQTLLGYEGKGSSNGIKTSPKTKRIGCSQLKTLIEGKKLIINDFTTYSELTTFIQVKNSWFGEEGTNDDTVTTLHIFGWLTQQDHFKDIVSNDIRKSLKLSEFGEDSDWKAIPKLQIIDGTEKEYEIFDSCVWERIG